MPGRDVGNHLGDKEGVVFGPLLLAVHGKVSGFLLEGMQTADACCKNDSYPVLVDTLSV